MMFRVHSSCYNHYSIGFHEFYWKINESIKTYQLSLRILSKKTAYIYMMFVLTTYVHMACILTVYVHTTHCLQSTYCISVHCKQKYSVHKYCIHTFGMIRPACIWHTWIWLSKYMCIKFKEFKKMEPYVRRPCGGEGVIPHLVAK
jgi:hypothetical protein